MNNYNEEYYIVLNDYRDDTLYVNALRKSADRDFEFERLIPGQEPLFFHNRYKEEDIKNGVKHQLPSILFNAPIPIVNNQIHDRLKFFDFDGMQLYPAIYIDDDGHYHENYWCMNFWEELDCIDRENSVLSERSQRELIEDPTTDDLAVDQYYLSAEVLDQVPEQDRLIFKIGGDDKGYVLVHQKIADIFKEENAMGVKLYKVSEYRKGMQFR